MEWIIFFIIVFFFYIFDRNEKKKNKNKDKEFKYKNKTEKSFSKLKKRNIKKITTSVQRPYYDNIKPEHDRVIESEDTEQVHEFIKQKNITPIFSQQQPFCEEYEEIFYKPLYKNIIPYLHSKKIYKFYHF